MSNQVFIQLVDFKVTTVKECVSTNDDGTYTIFLNSRLSKEEQLKAYFHALKHIQYNDFEKFDVQTIEGIAHNLEIAEMFTNESFLRYLQLGKDL